MEVQSQSHGSRLSATVALTILFLMAALGDGVAEMAIAGEEETCTRHHHHHFGERPVEVQRQLIGPGSSPPSCRYRCGSCFPCQPVHVAIQPGINTPLDYYPEVWRCKCGNKLFMP